MQKDFRMDFQQVKNYVLNMLETELDPRLHYHSIDHTLDVVDKVERIASAEGRTEHETELLMVAALLHDSGMIAVYDRHEEESVRIARKILPGFGYKEDDIITVCKLIMATVISKVPTHELEQIICDADLDYLGRADYFNIAHKLRTELEVLGIRRFDDNTWYEFQLDFLGNHRYFTQSSLIRNETSKQEHILQIKAMLSH